MRTKSSGNHFKTPTIYCVNKICLLCLYMSHWTFVLCCTEETDISILSYCRDKNANSTVIICKQIIDDETDMKIMSQTTARLMAVTHLIF